MLSKSIPALFVLGWLSWSAGSVPTGLQIPFQLDQDVASGDSAAAPNNAFEPLHHLSGISPYWSQHAEADDRPKSCNVTVAAYYIRHSSIYANDDEFEETMSPFQQKLAAFQQDEAKSSEFKHSGSLRFMSDWTSLVNESTMEHITPSGGQDALELGKRIGDRYNHILPNATTPFEIWTADADRDIRTARAFVKGLVPDHHGGDGGGDGHVKLKKVPVADPEWSVNLTPHKICDAWTKKRGRSERQNFEGIFTKPIIERLNKLLPSFDFDVEDVIAMFQLCGYDTVARGSRSQFCKVFTEDEFLAFEYSNDLHYYYMLGHGSHVGPYLGMPWLDTATKKLLAPPESYHPREAGDDPLPPPSKPPTDTKSQALWTYLTHREEPPTVLVALGLLNDTRPLPADHIPTTRQWQTSMILPFLGHVGLERLTCSEGDFVRLIVNEDPMPIPDCQDGPGRTCPLKSFKALIEKRRSIFDDFQEGCKKENKGSGPKTTA